jgi:hypothetical protein
MAGRTKAGAHPCTVHLSVVAHMDSKNTPLKKPIYRTKPYIQYIQYIQSMHIGHNWTHPLFCFYFDHCIIGLIACKYSVKMMQSMNGVFVNMKRMKILS